MHHRRSSPAKIILADHDKNNREKTIEQLSEASKVPLEHMFKNNYNCSGEWYFKTRASEEVNTYNNKDYEFCCKQNDNQIKKLLKQTLFPFQIYNLL